MKEEIDVLKVMLAMMIEEETIIRENRGSFPVDYATWCKRKATLTKVISLLELREKLSGVFPEKKIHKCLEHSIRDEDGEGGWCDTCQDTSEGSTLIRYGANQMREECLTWMMGMVEELGKIKGAIYDVDHGRTTIIIELDKLTQYFCGGKDET